MEYEKIHIRYGSKVETAVDALLQCREAGKLAYCVFNGIKLYSDTVTMDAAYKEITGLTKAEFDARHKKSTDNR